jgi:MoaA/NifB/PqqE/SkfB family radical SAM enzyme
MKTITVGGQTATIEETQNVKMVTSSDYNYLFFKKDGFFVRHKWTCDDDPEFSPFGMEIADIEISTVCSNACPFCYKSNTRNGKNMSLATFETIFAKFPPILTQIAFGIGDIDANPDLRPIFQHCRDHGIVPNVTINGSRMTPAWYDFLATTCGAVAVSLYDYETCVTAVEELGRRGLKQVNIHCLLSEETYVTCLGILAKATQDPRLVRYLNAIVFLWLKPKGDRNTYHPIRDLDKLKHLFETAERNKVRIGFDSCSASNFTRAVGTKYNDSVESCESTLFSVYIDVTGKAYPCSFSEGVGYHGVDVVACDDFLIDVWYSDEFKRFRAAVIEGKDENGCRRCPLYDLGCFKTEGKS